MNQPPARPSERAQRQIDRFLDDAEAAMARFDWDAVRDNARGVLRLDPDNPDALAFLAAASREPVEPLSPLPPGQAGQGAAGQELWRAACPRSLLARPGE